MDGTQGVIRTWRKKKSLKNPKLATRLRMALVVTLLAVLVLATIAAGVTAYLESSDVQDETLLSVARLVNTNQIETRLYESVDRNDDTDEGVHVWEIDGRQRGRFPLRKNIANGYHSVGVKGSLWRVYVTENPQSQKRYAVVQKLSVKTELATNSVINTALPLLGLFLLVPVLITLIVRHSFKPLNQLGGKVDSSQALQLDLTNRDEIPVEVLPFVNSIETLLDKNTAFNQRQRRFIADAAHELRTPITALSLEIENLRQAKNSDIRQLREASLKQSIDRLQRLVNQLLDLARAQSASDAQRSVVHLNTLLKNQIADLFVLAERKEIEIVVGRYDDAFVEDVNNQLQHLLRNALSNAIKFTPESGEIVVEIRVSDGWAEFCVTDTGPGVSEEHLARLHEPFYRPVEQATGTGAGLGLAICSEIATHLNGRLMLDNVRSGGFRFRYNQAVVQAENGVA